MVFCFVQKVKTHVGLKLKLKVFLLRTALNVNFSGKILSYLRSRATVPLGEIYSYTIFFLQGQFLLSTRS